MRLTAKQEWRKGGERHSVTLRAQVACSTVGEEVLDPAPYIRGCVRTK